MKTYYIEKVDKPRFGIHRLRMEQDSCKIYVNLNKGKNIGKVIERLVRSGTTNVVLSRELCENREFVSALNASNIKVFDGRWLEKYLAIEILEFVEKQKGIKKEEVEIAVTTNEISDFCLEMIRFLAKQYKRVTVVTNHIDKLRKIEKEIYDKDGILIVVSNNQKKSLLKQQIILNLDFNREVLNKYKINENASIINLEGDMQIYAKRFNGINVNDYEIDVGREEIIWRENMKNFRTKDLLEAVLYMKDTFHNIRSRIGKNKVSIKEVYGVNGKIERFS